MIVEDDEISAALLNHTIERLGYIVCRIVRSGEEAFEKAETDLPDLILMDILLAGRVDGIEAAKRIQSNLEIPVVFATAYDDQEKLDRAKLSNPVGYILKPYNDRQIKVSIEMALYVAGVEKKRRRAESSLQELNNQLEKRIEERTTTLQGLNSLLEREIAERKIVEKALRESEENYRTVADFTYDWEWWLDSDGRYIYVSPSCERITGYRADEFLQQQGLLERITHPDDRAAVSEHHSNNLNNPLELDLEFRIITRDGQNRWISHYCIPVYSPDGVFHGRRGSNRDVTKRKASEKALSEAYSLMEQRVAERTDELFKANEMLKHEIEENKRAEQKLRQAQKMEAIGTLAGGIAHDFNNILGAIMGYTQLAMTEASPGTQLYIFLREVFNAGLRAKDLIKQILTFSRQSEQSKQPFLIGTVIKEAIKLLRASLPATIEIQQNISHQVGPVLGDPTQIHQVLMNLCANASQAMADKGGVLGISLEEVAVTPEQAGSMGLGAGEYVRLRVSDTGPGIAAEIIDRIFEPYFTTKGIGEGTGLGLSTVLGIVELHGGVVKLHSEPGTGSTFSIYLPRHFSDTKQVTTVQEPMESGAEKILLIDDEKSLAEMVARMLKRLGYQVTMRTSSLEALELFRFQPDRFDLVITDQTMPQMTGMDLAKKILGIRPDIPIILCTGFSSAVTSDTIKAVGIHGLLMKPIIMEELAKTIRTIMETRNPQNQLNGS
ncbi:MAG: response regulator [Deltaproteobacteria bacterium]|nr:response regulator [Deltaproteobacteria bacterium]